MTTEDPKATFYGEMFEVQFSYLYHRLHREPWWGMDYALANFTMFRRIVKSGPGIVIDLGDLSWRATLAELWGALFPAVGDERGRFVDFAWRRFGERWTKGYRHFEQALLGRGDYFGCFRYDVAASGGAVSLHFVNFDEPASPFENLDKRRDDLRRIVLDVEAKGVRPARAGFDSWMNNLRPMLELFPPSHAQSLAACEEFPKGYGWWGQFITRDGRIHARRADLMKREGRFEFAKLSGGCPWADLRRAAGLS